MIPAQQRGLPLPAIEMVMRFQRLLASAPAQFDVDESELMDRGRKVAGLLHDRLQASRQAAPDAALVNARRLVNQATILLTSAIRQDRPDMLTRGTYEQCLEALIRIATDRVTAHDPETLLASMRMVALAAAGSDNTFALPSAAWGRCC